MLRLAENQRDRVLLLRAHYALGFSLALQGLSRLAHDHLERSIALYDSRKGATYGFVQDPGPTAMALLAHIVYKHGYPDQALRENSAGPRSGQKFVRPVYLGLGELTPFGVPS